MILQCYKSCMYLPYSVSISSATCTVLLECVKTEAIALNRLGFLQTVLDNALNRPSANSLSVLIFLLEIDFSVVFG